MKQNKKLTGAYKTYPLADPQKKDKKTGAAIPSEEDVIRAKDFVDGNKK